MSKHIPEDELHEHEPDMSESGSKTFDPSFEEIEYTTPEKEPKSPKEGSGESEAENGEFEDDSESEKEEELENENKDKSEHEDVQMNQQDDHALFEDNFTLDHNTPHIPSPRKSPSPIPHEDQPPPLQNLDVELEEGFNTMFLDPVQLIPFSQNPYQYYSMTEGFHPNDEMHGISQGQTSNTIPLTSYISPTKSSDNPLLEATRNFLISPSLDSRLNKPSSSSLLPEPSHIGSLGYFSNTDTANSNGLPKNSSRKVNMASTAAVERGPTNTDVSLNLIGLQQTVASYGNRQAIMNNWMLGDFLPVVAPNLPPPFLLDISYPILLVIVVPVPEPSDPAPPPLPA